MKKFFALLVVCTTFLCGLNAEVLMNESFKQNAGTLNSGDYNNMGTDTSKWWYTGSKTTYIQVIDTALTAKNYCSKKSGNAIQLKGATNTDVRAFTRVETTTTKTPKSLYYSALVNVRALKSSTSKEVLITLTDASVTSGYCYAELRFLNNYNDNSYQLGVTKANEVGVRWSEALPLDSTILVVVRYDFILGEKNDEAYLWINPTSLDEDKPTTQCVQDTASSTGNPWGAKEKVDPSGLRWVYLKPTANTANIILDEIRVATTWDELFEGGGDKPGLSVTPSSKDEGAVFQGDIQVETIKVKGVKLSADVTLSNKNAEVELSTPTITKSDAEDGATFTATITPQAEGEQTDTITVVSGTLEKQVILTWNTIGITDCANVAALKAAVAGKEAWGTYVRLTGEAVVTRDTTISYVRELYIEDASGAAKLTDEYSILDASTSLLGAKIKNLALLNKETVAGVQPFLVQGTPTIVSTGNEPDPQLVTLAELQANPKDYLLELVQVQKVTFADGGGTFKSGDWAISQEKEEAIVRVEMGNGITTNPIPNKANVIGFSLGIKGDTIVPRNIYDIIDADPVLLKNSSFEEYTSGTSFFGAYTEFEGWDMSGLTSAVLEAETTDVLDGKAAFKTTSAYNSNGYIYQEISCEDYAENDEFNIRVCYKNLDEKDSALVLDCYWESSTGSTEKLGQTAEMKQALPISQNWDSVIVRTAKPAGAKYFVFKVKIKKKAQVLLDNMDFKYYEDTVPYFAVLPDKRSYSFTSNINSDTVVARLTIRQRNLKEPVQVVWSKSTDKTVYSVSKSEVTAEEETVEVKFKASKTGKFNGTLNIMNDESTTASLCNTTISFEGTAIDPSKTPELSVTPMEFDTFRCKAYEEVRDTIYVTSSNCSEYVRCWANEQTGPDSLWAFGVSDSYLSKNATDTVILTFAPKKAGKYTATIRIFTSGADTVFIKVAGVAEEGQPTPVVVDWDTVFTWKQDKPYAILNEQFDHADTCRNKTLKTKDWQNVVLTGQRPWWGFYSDSTKQAKITSYYSFETPGTMPMENWLVTPALNYKDAVSQVFTFRVMGEYMQSEQTAKLEVYYIDATDTKDVWFQHIEAIDSLIPANDETLNGQWNEVYISLAGQEFIPEVFFMAFKFTDLGGTNGIVYYVDDVTWGVKEIPTGMVNVNANDNANRMSNVHKFVNNGKLYILKEGKRYNVLGIMQ